MATLGSLNPNGFFRTSFNPTELNKKSFSDTIMRLFPNGSAPLYALTGEINKKKAVAAEHGYFAKHFALSSMTVDDGSDLAAGDTTLVVDSTVGIVAGMVFQVPTTRENIRVNTITNATTAEIDRSFGRVAAGVIGDNDVLKLVGNSHVEASDRPIARSMVSTYVPNYTSIIRNAWHISNTARASLAEAGFNNIAESRQDCMEFHSTDFEGQLLWGQAVAPATDATTGNPIHSTQGLVDAIYEHASGNVNTAGATTTYAQLVTLVEPMFAHSTSKTGGGLKERMLFCDSTAIKVIHDIGLASGQVTMTTKETSFGMMFTEFKIYKGIIRLMEHPLLTETATATGIAIGVDLTAVGVAYLEGRDVKKEDYDGSADGSNSGQDASGGSLLSEFATEFTSPQTCGIINGITAAA
jgi:hypothetical protein